MRQEVITQLRSISGLSVEDLAKCMMVVIEKMSHMKTFLYIPDELKSAYCRVILQDNPLLSVCFHCITLLCFGIPCFLFFLTLHYYDLRCNWRSSFN